MKDIVFPLGVYLQIIEIEHKRIGNNLVICTMEQSCTEKIKIFKLWMKETIIENI